MVLVVTPICFSAGGEVLQGVRCLGLADMSPTGEDYVERSSPLWQVGCRGCRYMGKDGHCSVML